MPYARRPSASAVRTTARTAAFMPGASPPAVSTPMDSRLIWSPGVFFHVALERSGIRLYDFEALRQFLQLRQTRGTRRLAAERLADGIRELGRQRGLQADERHAGIAMRQPHFHAIGGVRVDGDAVF